ncbi:MAG: GNAT family N-acetyltransferase [Propionibacteriales bacterium]|nr:GNAT family N-acetyltransferase [Propionibacteriales bacterium]
MPRFDVHPATPERWPDVVTVMGTRGDPSRCFCQYFHLRGKDWSGGRTDEFRDRLCAQVAADVAPGVLAYDGGAPVGWCQVGPKETFARLASSKASAPPPDDPDLDDLWAITCLVVPAKQRRRGVAHALVEGAVAHATTHGATTVEAYPVDTGAKATVSSAELYHGTLAMFLAAGFTELRRPLPTRAVVRLTTG